MFSLTEWIMKGAVWPPAAVFRGAWITGWNRGVMEGGEGARVCRGIVVLNLVTPYF